MLAQALTNDRLHVASGVDQYEFQRLACWWRVAVRLPVYCVARSARVGDGSATSRGSSRKGAARSFDAALHRRILVAHAFRLDAHIN
jgi:hypothetical protein